MYTIDLESIKKLQIIYNSLNQMDVRGFQNTEILYKSMIALQQVLSKIETDNIDNTKGG